MALPIGFSGDTHLSRPLTAALPGSAAGNPPQPAEPPRRLLRRVAKRAGTSARKRPDDPLLAISAPGEVKPYRRTQQKPQPGKDSSPDHSHPCSCRVEEATSPGRVRGRQVALLTPGVMSTK